MKIAQQAQPLPVILAVRTSNAKDPREARAHRAQPDPRVETMTVNTPPSCVCKLICSGSASIEIWPCGPSERHKAVPYI